LTWSFPGLVSKMMTLALLYSLWARNFTLKNESRERAWFLLSESTGAKDYDQIALKSCNYERIVLLQPNFCFIYECWCGLLINLLRPRLFLVLFLLLASLFWDRLSDPCGPAAVQARGENVWEAEQGAVSSDLITSVYNVSLSKIPQIFCSLWFPVIPSIKGCPCRI
jgi:hypothetical protein